jgi:hypothetical protein
MPASPAQLSTAVVCGWRQLSGLEMQFLLKATAAWGPTGAFADPECRMGREPCSYGLTGLQPDYTTRAAAGYNLTRCILEEKTNPSAVRADQFGCPGRALPRLRGAGGGDPGRPTRTAQVPV